MGSWQTVVLVLAADVGIVLAVVAGYRTWRAVQQQRVRTQVAQAFAEHFKQTAPERRQALVQLLQELGIFNEQDLERNAVNLINCERSVYSRVLKIYTDGDAASMTSIDEEIQALAAGYRGLATDLQQELASRKSDSDGKELTEVRERNRLLRDENERLKDDLKRSMESVDRILNEYASMYSGGHAEGAEGKEHSKKRIEAELEKLGELTGRANE